MIVGACVGAAVGFMVFGAIGAAHDSNASKLAKDYVTGKGDREFFASDSQFRATFPSLPKRSTQAGDFGGTPGTITLYTSASGDNGFSVSTFDLAANQAFDLNMAVNGAAAAVKGHVERSTLRTYQGLPAVEYVVSTDANHLFMKALIVRAPTRVYQLQVVGRTDPPDGYDKFAASFVIVR